MNHIPTSEIQGPPFPCPECATDGKRTSFEKRGGLGSHRFSQHSVTGTSTGSTAYKMGKLPHKKAVAKTRTYVKRTSRGPYNKTPKVNPMEQFLNNPSQLATKLDTMIYGKKSEVENLQFQISELNNSIAFLERFRNVFTETPAQDFQQVA